MLRDVLALLRTLEGDAKWKVFQSAPGYVYQSPYLTATAPGSLVPLQATQLTHAAAVAAAATSQFYEYQNAAAVAAAAAAPYTGQYTNGFDAYTPYTGAAGKEEGNRFLFSYVYVCVQLSL